MIARVVINSPLPQLDRLFDYEIPAQLAEEVAVGIRVRVQFGRSKTLVEAFVVEVEESSGFDGKLSAISEVVSSVPVLDSRIYTLIRAVADRQAATASDVIRLAIPDRAVAVEKKWLATNKVADHMNTVAQPVRVTSIVAPFTTASGPTWVNDALNLAKMSLSAGLSTIIVVPDFRDQDAVLRGFKELEANLINLSTATTKAKRYENFLRCLSDDATIVVGSRSAIYAPVRNLGQIIVWDDGDQSHQEQISPYSHTREVALIRQSLERCNIHFLGHCRSTEIQRLVTLNYLVDATSDFQLPKIANSDGDLRVDSMAWRVIREGLSIGPVLVQVSSRGNSSSAFCSNCDHRAECRTCNGPLWIDDRNQVRCRWCNAVNLDHKCSLCASPKLKHGAAGTTRTVAEFGNAFPGVQIIEATGDSRLEVLRKAKVLVVSTPGSEPRVEGGYSAVVILDAKRSLNKDTLRATEDAIRQWSNAIALANAESRSVLVGVSGILASKFSLWAQREISEQELKSRIELRFPPTVRLASVGASRNLLDEVVQNLSDIPGIELLGPVPISDKGLESEWRILIKYEYSEGVDLAKALQAISMKLSAGQQRFNQKSGRAMRPIRIKMDDAEVI
jgi:primosomal protein N' (replication factor Y)